MQLNEHYWKARYQNNDTGWDVGTITAPLKEYLEQLTNKQLRILIPGAGNGHEYEYLIGNGFETVDVVDIVQAPLNAIRKRVTNAPKEHLVRGDFFEHQGTYDLIIEQTFFCALEPSMRAKYVQKMHSLLAPQGKLVGLLFQFPLTEVGPPFGGSVKEYRTLFDSQFSIKTLNTAYNSIQPRKGNELFFIFVKK